MKSPVDEEKDAPGNKKKEDTDESNKRLRKELVKRDGNKLVHTFLLVFLSYSHFPRTRLRVVLWILGVLFLLFIRLTFFSEYKQYKVV
jgi:hypothetical protein